MSTSKNVGTLPTSSEVFHGGGIIATDGSCRAGVKDLIEKKKKEWTAVKWPTDYAEIEPGKVGFYTLPDDPCKGTALNQNLGKILAGKATLTVYTFLRYKDGSMPNGWEILTEQCLWFRGNISVGHYCSPTRVSPEEVSDGVGGIGAK